MKQKIATDQLDQLNEVGMERYLKIWGWKRKSDKEPLATISEMVEFISNQIDGWDILDRILINNEPDDFWPVLNWCDHLWDECVEILNKEEKNEN